MEKTIDIESVSMLLIAHSGDARTLAYRALDEAKKERFQESEKLMEESEEASLLAHKVQTDLLISEANGNKNEINVLLIHAQDHLMTSMLAQELIKEIIYLHKEKEQKKENEK